MAAPPHPELTLSRFQKANGKNDIMALESIFLKSPRIIIISRAII